MASFPHNYFTVAEVVDDRLCHSCGVCGGICPKQAITFDAGASPVVDHTLCNRCGLCLQVCSGWQGQACREVLSEDCDPARYFLVASSDPSLRRRSSSGGLVTELLRFLLRSGKIARALVTVADPQNPARPISILAETEEELLRSSQSRYALFPWGAVISQLLKSDEPFAAVGTSCQLSSLKNVLRLYPKKSRNLVALIGICCESNIEPTATDHLLRIRGVNPSDLSHLEYRNGSWPGVMAAFLKDGQEVVLSNRNRLEGAINYLKLTYGRDRCRFCSDVLCDSADITAGDPWGRDEQGRLSYRGSEGYTSVQVRSRAVLAYLQEMQRQGLIELQEETRPETVLGVQQRQVKALRTKVVRRMVSAQRKGRRCPQIPAVDAAAGSGLTPGEQLYERLRAAAGKEPGRSLILRLLFSPVGDMVTWLNALHKQHKSRRKQKG